MSKIQCIPLSYSWHPAPFPVLLVYIRNLYKHFGPCNRGLVYVFSGESGILLND